MVPFADQHVEIPSMTAGNIALTVGLKQVEHHALHAVFGFSFRKVIYDYSLLFKTITGDTIVSSKASAAVAAQRACSDGTAGKKSMKQTAVVLSGVEVPDPVFFCTIEPPTMAKQAGQSQ